jgi:hypothetical protein
MNILPGRFNGYLYHLNLIVFQIKKKTESPLLLTIIIGDVYLLHIINETVSILCPLKNLIYTYKYMKIIILIGTITLHDGLSRLLYLYYGRSGISY